MNQSYQEARLRQLEERLRIAEDVISRLMDQVGMMNQMVNLTRQATGRDPALPTIAKVAKNGGSAIGAMTGGNTPGSGTVTIYDYDGTTVSSAATETAKNLHPTSTVAANAWLKVIKIDGYYFVFWEPC